MKKVILLVWLMPYLAYGQILENFESGNLNNWRQSSAGRWTADTAESISGSYSLHHIFDNSDSGTDQIGISINNLHPSEGIVSWSFIMRHGYDPSSSNNWAVFLMSDTDPSATFTDGTTNGYALGVNLTGYDDTLRLWKIRGSSVSTVVNCGLNWQTVIGTANAAKISVERTPDGNWNVSVSRLPEDLVTAATGTDNQLFDCGWFIVSYKYSSSRDRLFWLDDLEIDGIFYENNEVPVITGCQAAGRNSIRITVNDQPDDNFMIPSNFSLNPGNLTPVSIVRETPSVYSIGFADEFINRSDYSLTLKDLCNRNGNCLKNINVLFTPLWPETGDIVISELMADPEPVVSLPGREYIEITNRTGNTYNIKNWKLSSGGQDYIFPDQIIDPYEIIVICATQDTSEFSKYGKVMGLKQLPALTDNGKLILLYDTYGELIHGVEYSSEWYNDELKSRGGWSLEMIDTGFPFYYDGNWTSSSSDNGGTPGDVNSAAGNNPDNFFSGNLIVFPDDSLNISVRSREPLFSLLRMSESIFIDGNSPLQICLSDPLFRGFTVKLNNPLKKGKEYQFFTSGEIMDFAGNKLMKDKVTFGLTERAAAGDILFNELLFNGWPGDPDYLELFNFSGKIIDAARLGLVSVNDGSGDTSQICMVSDDHKCIMPGEYYAVTTDIEKVSARYFSADPDHLFENGSFPSMPDDKGHLILLSRELDKIDEVAYTEKMQSTLLSGYEGVALEKVNPGNKSEEARNWHSASESSGWGTPGAPNSVYSEINVASDVVNLSSSRITPDDDGSEDFLKIDFMLAGNSNVVSVTIFDETGNYVRNVAENMYVGTEASLLWDGTADDGSMVNTGIYIVFITMFDDYGKTSRWKKVCTVIRR